MAGLPTKNSQFEEQFMYPDGAPKEGTKGYYYLQMALQKAEYKAYLAGVKFTINDIAKRLEPLVYMTFDEENEEEKFEPLPPYADRLEKLIKCLKEYSKGLKTQINNLNRTNFREGTRTLILRSERILGEKKGDIINPLLKVRVSKITETRGNKPGVYVGQGRKRIHPLKEKEEEVQEPADPSDVLKNEVIEEE